MNAYKINVIIPPPAAPPNNPSNGTGVGVAITLIVLLIFTIITILYFIRKSKKTTVSKPKPVIKPNQETELPSVQMQKAQNPPPKYIRCSYCNSKFIDDSLRCPNCDAAT